MSKLARNVKVGDAYWYKGKHVGTITDVQKEYTFVYRDKKGNSNCTMRHHEDARVEVPETRTCGYVKAGDVIDCCGIWRVVAECKHEHGYTEFVFADTIPPQRVVYKTEDVVALNER